MARGHLSLLCHQEWPSTSRSSRPNPSTRAGSSKSLSPPSLFYMNPFLALLFWGRLMTAGTAVRLAGTSLSPAASPAPRAHCRAAATDQSQPSLLVPFAPSSLATPQLLNSPPTPGSCPPTSSRRFWLLLSRGRVVPRSLCPRWESTRRRSATLRLFQLGTHPRGTLRFPRVPCASLPRSPKALPLVSVHPVFSSGQGFGHLGSPFVPSPHPHISQDKAASFPHRSTLEREEGSGITAETRVESASRRRAAAPSPSLALDRWARG
jgi:hypothetical protein